MTIPRLKLPRALARRLARLAAETGMSLDEAAEHCLRLAARPSQVVFISHSWLDPKPGAFCRAWMMEVNSENQ